MGTTRVLEIVGEDVVEEGFGVIGANVVNSSSIGCSVVVGSTSATAVVVSAADSVDWNSDICFVLIFAEGIDHYSLSV